MMKKIYMFILQHYLFAVTLLGVFLYTLYIGQKDFGQDEISSFIFTQDWQNMLHILRYQEGNMWLYYFLLFFWSKFGSSEVWLRLLSAIFAVINIPFFYYLTKKITNDYISKIATILFVLNIFVIQNAQNARSYSLLVLLTTMSCYFFVSYILKNKKMFLMLVAILNALAFYSHLYGVFIIMVEFLSLFFFYPRVHWKDTLLTFLGTIVLCLPYLLAPSLHSGQIDWISKPDIRQIIKTYIILANDFLPLTLISFFLFLNYFILLLKTRRQFNQELYIWKYEFIFLWLIFPIITAYIFSLLIKPIYFPMYFVIIVAPFTILLACTLASIKNINLRNGILIIFIIFSLVRLYGWYTENPRLNFVFFNKNEDWRKVDTFLSLHAKSSDAIISFPSSVLDYGDFYAKKDNISFNGANQVRFQPNRLIMGNVEGQFNSSLLTQIPNRYQRVWYIYADYLDPKIEYQRKMIEDVLNKKYSLQQKYVFSILTVYRYDKSENIR